MTADDPCKHVVVYDLSVSDRVLDHERWLVEWAIDWIDSSALEAVSIDRTETRELTTYHVTVEAVPCSAAVTPIEELCMLLEGAGVTVDRRKPTATQSAGRTEIDDG